MAKKAEAEAGTSLLEVAWKAYAAGDQVTARRAAQLLLAGASKDADEALAKKIAAELFAVEFKAADARAVATEIVTRTRMPPKPFLLAAAAGLIWLVLALIANRG
jgi:enoyl-CoA hydratase/carnithine racemase